MIGGHSKHAMTFLAFKALTMKTDSFRLFHNYSFSYKNVFATEVAVLRWLHLLVVWPGILLLKRKKKLLKKQLTNGFKIYL